MAVRTQSSVTSVILGVFSAVSLFPFAMLPFGIAGVVCGVRSTLREGKSTQATVGIILSAAGSLLALVTTVIAFFVVKSVGIRTVLDTLLTVPK